MVYADDIMAELIGIDEELRHFLIGCYSIIRPFPRLLKHELTISLNTLISGTGLHMPDDTKQLELCVFKSFERNHLLIYRLRIVTHFFVGIIMN